MRDADRRRYGPVLPPVWSASLGAGDVDGAAKDGDGLVLRRDRFDRVGESTDPETLQGMLARYFDRMSRIIIGHGGTVEKFIGDAVMAVFGIPAVHEDDALRACRAAVEMREALPDLGLNARIGVMTGEVMAGTVERLATGDAVNVAARLEQAAGPGEVLIGQATWVLVRAAVDAEPVAPLGPEGQGPAGSGLPASSRPPAAGSIPRIRLRGPEPRTSGPR